MGGRPVIHLHGMFGREDGTLIGGHIFDATVFTTAELVILEITDTMVVKSRDEATGMAEMRAADRPGAPAESA
jgi:predicted DNA-binding protein with PD1-like motif